jgi:hypothetical protein
MLQFLNGAGNRLDNKQYWTMAEAIGIPGASKILDSIEDMEQQQQQIQEQQGMEQPQQQPDMMDEVLNSLSPEELAEIEKNPEILQQIMGGMQSGM